MVRGDARAAQGLRAPHHGGDQRVVGPGVREGGNYCGIASWSEERGFSPRSSLRSIGWALGELPGHDNVLWLVPVCVFIAIATGPALTGGWLMLAGLATSPVYAWSFIVAYDHHPNTSETNDALAGI